MFISIICVIFSGIGFCSWTCLAHQVIRRKFEVYLFFSPPHYREMVRKLTGWLVINIVMMEHVLGSSCLQSEEVLARVFKYPVTIWKLLNRPKRERQGYTLTYPFSRQPFSSSSSFDLFLLPPLTQENAVFSAITADRLPVIKLDFCILQHGESNLSKK